MVGGTTFYALEKCKSSRKSCVQLSLCYSQSNRPVGIQAMFNYEKILVLLTLLHAGVLSERAGER